MAEALLTLSQAAEIVPLSKTTLYRVAERNSGPFQKVEGRWLVYESELHAWVRSHRSRTERRADPMPASRTSRFDNKVVELRSRRANVGS